MGVFLLVVHPLYTTLDEQTYSIFYMYIQVCFVLIRNKILSYLILSSINTLACSKAEI